MECVACVQLHRPPLLERWPSRSACNNGRTKTVRKRKKISSVRSSSDRPMVSDAAALEGVGGGEGFTVLPGRVCSRRVYDAVSHVCVCVCAGAGRRFQDAARAFTGPPGGSSSDCSCRRSSSFPDTRPGPECCRSGFRRSSFTHCCFLLFSALCSGVRAIPQSPILVPRIVQWCVMTSPLCASISLLHPLSKELSLCR